MNSNNTEPGGDEPPVSQIVQELRDLGVYLRWRDEKMYGLITNLLKVLSQQSATSSSTSRQSQQQSSRIDGVGTDNETQASYLNMIARVRDAVDSTLPKEATVIVISKGDEELLKLNGRTGWHYPQREDGKYAGHYPSDSDAAISQLESLLERGGQFLLIPRTSFWWLDHYTGLRENLERRHRVVFRRNDTCVIFALVSRISQDGVGDDKCENSYGRSHVVRQTSEIVDSLLPEKTQIAMIGAIEGLTDLKGRTVKFLSNGAGTDSAVNSLPTRDELRRLRENGTEYLLIPASESARLDDPDFRDYVDKELRLVIRQRFVCSIYSLVGNTVDVT